MIKPKSRLFLDAVVGFSAVVILILLKVYVVEGSFTGHWINIKGYEVLHKLISPFSRNSEPSVVVLDISELKREPDGTTPAQSLREIVEALIASKAKAIAIDLDFGSRSDLQGGVNGGPDVGPRAENDEEFFKFLRELKRSGKNVFVGIYNPAVDSDSWITPKEYKDLAAYMTLFDEDTTLVPRWMKCGNEEPLKSISMALAESSNLHPLPFFLPKAFLNDREAPVNIEHFVQDDKMLRPVPCERAFTFVNYAKLEFLQGRILQASDKKSVYEAKFTDGTSKFENKLVIIGNTQRGMSDCFVVPGQEKPIAGAYLHAAAVYSLVDEPVYELRPIVIVVLDFILGSIIVGGLFRVRWGHLKDNRSPYLGEGRFIFIAIVGAVGAGLLFAKLFNVLWLDFSLVILALLLHSQVQKGLLWIPKSLWRSKAEQPQKE